MSGDLSRTASENEFNNIMSDLSIEDIEENLRQQQLKQYETIQKQVMQSLEEPQTQEALDRAIARMRQTRIKIAELKGPAAASPPPPRHSAYIRRTRRRRVQAGFTYYNLSLVGIAPLGPSKRLHHPPF